MAKISGKAVIANKEKSLSREENTSFVPYLIYMNDGVRVCAQACSCCWDKPIPDTYEGQVDYLGKRCKTGHTSVIEHSNLVMLIKFPYMVRDTNQIRDAIEALSKNRYLNATMSTDSNGVPYVLIGGSWRGYDFLFKMCRNADQNSFLKAVAEILYDNVNSAIFIDLANDNILNKDRFVNIEPDPSSIYFNPIPEKPFYEDDKIKFVSVDSIKQIKYNLRTIIGEDIFTDDDLADMASITILFKDMSRTATHQLVRHRNAITQESQRYVDYSNAAFADPTTFKPDKYDPDQVYEITFGGQTFHMTSNELGEAIIGTYECMRDQGMLKEDARSFLPGNVKCRKLYMTFTYRTFMKFLELRCHSAAQAEIRSFALACRDASEEIFYDLGNSVRILGVDEIISDKEVIMDNIIKSSEELNQTED